MTGLSKKTLFALEAVVDIAYNARPEPVQAREITRRQGIPQRYLEQVMQELVRAGILKGVRGPKGGYFLARERRRITAAEVVRVVKAMESTGGPQCDGNSDLAGKVVTPLSQDIETMVMARLEDITIEDLCRRATVEGLANRPGAEATTEHLDFTI